jgi:aspartate 1-decarboxylase
MRRMLKSKIHGATVTGANVDYEGSITIDKILMERADILFYEEVQVLDVDNGARLTTYAIPGEEGSGIVEINGAAARLIFPGDKVIILSYELAPSHIASEVSPKIVHVGSRNEAKEEAKCESI